MSEETKEAPATETKEQAPASLWSEDKTEAPAESNTPTAPEGEAIAATESDESPSEIQSEPPDWFMSDKYKTTEDQAKAYPELLKKVGKFWGAPDGEYKISEELNVAGGDPLLKHMGPHLKDLGLSNDGFNKLIKTYQQATLSMANEMAAEVAKELTSNDAQTVQVVDKWMKDNFDNEDRSTMQGWIQSVGDFKLLNRLRAMLPTANNVPSSVTTGGVRAETYRDVESEKLQYLQDIKKGERVKDRAVEERFSNRWKDAYLRENKK